ncbi:hypothetical protein [Cedratvirus kamchatka]|uniref:Uncharacterized protein n=1 Tax=Cedratvirus kamchatka TaxID=2716914 RepID=A0A6G8MX11_9VIRU|nr:hypothetical protein [Cedratvirus kamchatka]
MHRDIHLSVVFAFPNHEGDVSMIEELLCPDYYRVLENNSRLLPEDSVFFLLPPEKPVMTVHDTCAVFYFPVFTMKGEFTSQEFGEFYKLWLRERQGVFDCGQEPNYIC